MELEICHNGYATQGKGDMNTRAGRLHQFGRHLELYVSNGCLLNGNSNELGPDPEDYSLVVPAAMFARQNQFVRIGWSGWWKSSFISLQRWIGEMEK
jgi:hypothetical protein